MILRVIILLVCVLIFVNGCNSLISSLGGTHKLRTLSMEEVRADGLGDADFVAIEEAWSSGDYIFEPHRNPSWLGFVQWPVLSRAQLDSLENNMPVTVDMVAWTKKYEEGCVEKKDCVSKGPFPLKGLVRPLNDRFLKIEELPDDKYQLAEEPIYIEYNRQPLAWYWNLAMMLGAAALAIGVEIWVAGKRKKGGDGSAAASE